MADRFPSPFDIETPEGAEGWQEMYVYPSLFSEARKDFEESMFWFQDGVHWPQVMTPWDATFFEFAITSLSQYNTRHLQVPPANGIAFRILNGYGYLTPVPADPATIEDRVANFMDRAGFYFMNWDDLYDKWMIKIRNLVQELESINFEPLPEIEDADEVVKSGAGLGSGYKIQENYRTLVDLSLKLWNYHFEFLNLGYAAYLDFFGFCKQAFPGIPDLAIAKMVAGVEVDLFRPDEELKRLARVALDSGVADAFTVKDVEQTCQILKGTDAGQAWIASFQESAEPWFNFSTGSGFYHQDKIWIENVEIPFDFINDYIIKLQAGEDLARPMEAIRAERDRVVGEYSELLASDEDREAFQAKLGLARVVFPYVENHNFYVEHWSHSVIWRKMRQLGEVFVKEGFWGEANDIFYLKRTEVEDALWDYYVSWATPEPAAGPGYWPGLVEKRKGICNALKKWKPVPALGAPPEIITEPFTVMLWGITSDSVTSWLGGGDAKEGELRGMAASPGLVEGPARVIFSPDQISEIQQGEILVAPLTAPSWAPIFGKILATVTDTGGMMSHAAIVCREYGLPAVTGTGFATSTITTGQRIRVDGNNGTVTIIE
ncbi:MAG: PEP-utilizing enzyme [Candidatus Nanopelagicales bacterium]|jgi:pyruvate, water dikinase|nr:PEP-utilizing enzyme [Candidatus Nanopelagicales bacterium]MDP4714690.1 PEP-utilizing enzyme [Candidatus Nanopelagicales bacterium]MDP4906594.1 PEP-utilizing enzyme [Candidatus Nanopelagicales bacterium]MDP4974442.1 PEP-utilizing enzyme [Candidatus Nanopelagicales bacterium]MDP5095946.1 PEP-utilizing enzyme [Candidatus Nanopelagicales bacterium]